jgi:hypothetical protein
MKVEAPEALCVADHPAFIYSLCGAHERGFDRLLGAVDGVSGTG